MCSECFDVNLHSVRVVFTVNGRIHDYCIEMASEGGCCDCGDITSWKKELWCPKHQCTTMDESQLASLNEMLLQIFSLIR